MRAAQIKSKPQKNNSSSNHILFENARLVFQDFIIEGALLVENGSIAAIWISEKPSGIPRKCRVIDCEGLLLAPGLVDIHNHGGKTHDFVAADAEGNNVALRFHAEN